MLEFVVGVDHRPNPETDPRARTPSASGAELCSIHWLSDSIRRLVVMRFLFGLFTTCKDTLFLVLGGIFADDDRFQY